MNARQRLLEFLGGDQLKPTNFGTRKPTFYLDLEYRRWLVTNLNGVTRDATELLHEAPYGTIPESPGSMYRDLFSVHVGEWLYRRGEDEQHLGVISVYFLEKLRVFP